MSSAFDSPASTPEDEPSDLLERLSLFFLRRRAMPAHAHDAIWIGRYCLVEKYSEGAMGVVYRALDPQFPERPVAIKIPKAVHSDALRRRIREEGVMLARVRHTHVLTVYEVGECEGTLFIATEFVAGGSLRTWQAERTRTWHELLALYLQIGDGLAEIHRKGVVHQDIKPDNVAIDDDGRARVLDFGLAHLESSLLAASSAAGVSATEATFYRGGTPGYMAPEQYLQAAVDARADQFAFCACLWEALHGGLPYTREAIASTVLGQPRRPLGRPAHSERRTPGWLRQILLRGLSELPQDRHATMDALLAAIRQRLGRRWWPLASLMGTGVLVGVALAVVVLPPGLDQCVDPVRALAGVWDDARRATLDARVTVSDVAAAGWPRVRDALDRAAAAWSSAQARACASGQDVSQRAASQRCFSRQRALLERTVAAIAEEPRRVVTLAGDMRWAIELERSADCADVQRLRAPAWAGEALDPSLLAAAEEAESAGSLALFLRDAQTAEVQLQRARLLQRRLGDAGREAQLELDLGAAALLRGDLRGARVRFTAATGAAARARDPVASLRAWERVLFVLTVLQRPDEALDLLPSAEGLAAADGQALTLDTGALLLTGAEAALRMDAAERAEPLLQRAEAALHGAARAGQGSEHAAFAVFLEARHHELRGWAAELRGDRGLGCAWRAQADAALRDQFGPLHPTRVPGLRQLGLCYLEDGQVAAAIPVLADAEAAAGELAPADIERGLVEYALARLADAEGRSVEALRHGQVAAAILERPGQETQLADRILVAELLGSLYLQDGDLKAARDTYIRGLAVARHQAPASLSIRGHLVQMQASLADVSLRQGQVSRARREIEPALRAVASVDEPWSRLYVFGTAAMIGLRCGDTQGAAVLAGRALELATATMHPADLAELHWIFAESLNPEDPRRVSHLGAAETYYAQYPGECPERRPPVPCPDSL